MGTNKTTHKQTPDQVAGAVGPDAAEDWEGPVMAKTMDVRIVSMTKGAKIRGT